MLDVYPESEQLILIRIVVACLYRVTASSPAYLDSSAIDTRHTSLAQIHTGSTVTAARVRSDIIAMSTEAVASWLRVRQKNALVGQFLGKGVRPSFDGLKKPTGNAVLAGRRRYAFENLRL